MDGPETALVNGLVCTEVASLAAAVMMPGIGKYSQFEYPVQGKARCVWISAAKVRV